MSTVAIVDDDVYIGNMIEEVLVKEGYKVMRAYSGTEALMLFDSRRPDLVLLDLMLPGLSGEQVLARIREIPVIVLSAKVDVADKVNLLLEGAADYLTKPFDIQELLARITVQLRNRTVKESRKRLAFEGLWLDEELHEVHMQERSARLTKTEYAILKLLMQRPGQVITKTFLLDSISEDTPDCVESSLKVHVSNLRKKLRDISGRDYIEAVWGIGFRLMNTQASGQ